MPPKKGKKPQLDFDFEATAATDFFSAQAEATADAPSTKKKGKKKLEFEDDDLDEMFKTTKKSTKKPSDDQPPPAPQGVVINRANLSTLSNLTTTTPTTTNGGDGSSDDDIFASLPTTKASTTTPRTTTTTQQQQPPRGEDTSIGEESGVQSMQQRVLELRRQQLSLAASSASPPDHPAQPHLPAAHTNALATAGTAAPSSASILGQQHKIKTTAQAHQHQTLIDAQQRQHLQHQQQLRAQQQREQYQQHHRNQITGQNDVEENDEEEEEFTFIRKKDRKNIKKLQVDAPTLFTGGDGEEHTLAQLEAMNMAATAAVKDQIERDANVLTEEQRKAQEELPDDKDYFDDLYLEVTKWREREAKRLLQELNDRLQYLSLEETERDEDGNKPAAGDDSDEYYVVDTDSDGGGENGEGKDKKEKILQKHGLTREDYQKKKEDRAAWKRLDADQKVVRRRKERDGQEISAHEFYAKKITKLDLHQPKNNNDRSEQKDVSYTTDDFARTNKHKHDERYSKHMSLYQEEPPK